MCIYSISKADKVFFLKALIFKLASEAIDLKQYEVLKKICPK